jgi:hypothetical protein
MTSYTSNERPLFSLLIALLVVILCPSVLLSEVDSTINQNNPPPLLEGQILFEDYFEDNKNKWRIEINPLFRIYIENGNYILEQTMDGKERTTVNYSFILPDDIDFKLEALIEKIQGEDSYGYGLIWGSLDINNQYRFYVSDNGNYSIKKHEKGKGSYIIPWSTFRENDKQNAKNKLTIVKYGDLTHFYINDEYLGEIPNLSLDGNKVGFVIDGAQKTSVDYIRITKIEAGEVSTDKEALEPREGSLPEKIEEEK